MKWANPNGVPEATLKSFYAKAPCQQVYKAMLPPSLWTFFFSSSRRQYFSMSPPTFGRLRLHHRKTTAC
jgi:hypothetical protein